MEHLVSQRSAFWFDGKPRCDIRVFGQKVERPTDGRCAGLVPGKEHGDDFIANLLPGKRGATRIPRGNQHGHEVVAGWLGHAAVDEGVEAGLPRRFAGGFSSPSGGWSSRSGDRKALGGRIFHELRGQQSERLLAKWSKVQNDHPSGARMGG